MLQTYFLQQSSPHKTLILSSSRQQTSTPLIVGDTNPSTLATNLLFMYHPSPQIKIKSRIQTGAFPYASGFRSSTTVLEYLVKSSTVSLAIHDPKRDSCRMTIGFLHGFNRNFCAGLELLAGWRTGSSMEANVAFAGRYVRSIALLPAFCGSRRNNYKW